MLVVCILPVSKHIEDSDSILTDGVCEKTHEYFAGKLSRERKQFRFLEYAEQKEGNDVSISCQRSWNAT